MSEREEVLLIELAEERHILNKKAEDRACEMEMEHASKKESTVKESQSMMHQSMHALTHALGQVETTLILSLYPNPYP